MALDTDDVMVWESLGLGLRRARALARWLDDEEPVGISSFFLTHLIRAREDKVRQHWMAETARLRAELASMQEKMQELEMHVERDMIRSVQ